MTKEWRHDRTPRPYGRSYLGWYGLAWAGATIAYQPFLSFLLPLRIVEIGGRPDPVLLSAAVLLGGLTAGLANLGWGILGDHVVERGGARRPLILVGLAGTLFSYGMLALADSPAELLIALFCFQIALNLLLSALVAAAADEVPARDKGLLGGVLCVGAPAGAAASVLATLPEISVERSLFCTALIVPIFVLPYALQRHAPYERLLVQEPSADRAPEQLHAFVLLWFVRLLLQIASKAMFFFLVYYFAETVRQVRPTVLAQLTLIAAVGAAPSALFLGRLSDRYRGHRTILLVMIAAMAGGLIVMAVQTNWILALFGYLIFACSAAVCLALHAGFAMLRLPTGLASGKGLGLLNLTNTLPAVAVAGLGMAIVPQYGYRVLCWVLAAAVIVAGGALTYRRL
ncbi:major facilitator superfamily protein [Sphingomonas mucosissima]|uniref:Major facilitator superfamily protein n=1 Tax=Sphingomonas mucosissima TaxID=370959 RepID=A0A245ZJM5_9SPHN|nr:major facilitator superfamily protein [Sphingomonas mucosissima]